ncbi:MAG: glycosyltransferase [Ktedonobacteraceae bacterium]
MQATKPTILIFTVHIGGGHLNLAQALKEMLATHYDVTIVNPLPEMVDRWYTAISRHFVHVLAWQFKYTDNAFASFLLHRILTLLVSRRLLRSIERVQPQLILTTHAWLSYALARANERVCKRVPLVFQLTDLGRVHMTWFTEKRADAYFAPTREIFAQALACGIAHDRLYLTGRPVRRQFLDSFPAERSVTLAALNFDPAICTLFLQGGAKGSAQIDHIVEHLLRASIPVQIILAVGNNTRMAASYAAIEQVRTVSFTQTIAPYMAAADIIVGKAGASFISEAFMLEKPFLVTAVIPDQETPNLAFIERHNLGWVRLEPTAQQELLLKIVRDPTVLAAKVNAIRAYKTWNRQANQDICAVIDQLLS